jgi:hypothetical protein
MFIYLKKIIYYQGKHNCFKLNILLYFWNFSFQTMKNLNLSQNQLLFTMF